MISVIFKLKYMKNRENCFRAIYNLMLIYKNFICAKQDIKPEMHDIKLFKYSKNRFPFPFQGTGTSEHALIEILTTRTSRQMKEISQAYYTGGLVFGLLLPLCTHIGASVALPRNPPSSSSQSILGRQDVKRRIHSKMG